MHAIAELIQAPQDIARYEFAIGVYRNDDPTIYNSRRAGETPVYSSDMASEHIRWAWQQAPNLTGATGDAVMSYSTLLSRRFKSLILLTASETRWKISRLACAIAALAYSTGEDGKIKVDVVHVEHAYNFLESIYGDDKFNYDKYSGRGLAEESEEVVTFLRKLGSSRYDFIYYNDVFTGDMIDSLCEGVTYKAEFLKILLIRNSCLVRKSRGYYKTQAFKELLEEVKGRL